MQSLFDKSVVYGDDIFVADYTEAKKGVGVVFSATPFDDIESFHLIVNKKADIQYLAVNIEEYPAFKKGMQNCEAVLVSLNAGPEGSKWALFLELKYCGERRIADYGPKAIDQMETVRRKLINMNKLSRDQHIFHFNYCSPNNYEIEPFDGFRETQSATLERVESDGVVFHARMELIAVNGGVILEPAVEI